MARKKHGKKKHGKKKSGASALGAIKKKIHELAKLAKHG